MRTWKDLKESMAQSPGSGNSETSHSARGPFRYVLDQLQLLRDLWRDYRRGAYQTAPWWAMLAIGFAIAYVILPLDLIPDVIPVVGYADDSVLLLLCIKLVEQQIADYRAWKVRS
jgi:uncharacterized membrane protein YkvA (DUF1232 family)